MHNLHARYRLFRIRFYHLQKFVRRIASHQIAVPTLLQKVLPRGAVFFIPIAIGVGVSIADDDPTLALYWFSAATIAAVIAIFLWDEIAQLDPAWRIGITVVGVLAALISVWRGDLWVAKKSADRASTTMVQEANESKTSVAQLRPKTRVIVALSDQNTTTSSIATAKVESPHKVPPPRSSTSTPPAKGPRLGIGPEAYKDIEDAQVAQWAIEEADKIEEMASELMSPSTDAASFKAEAWFFSNDFKSCCAQDVKDLRSEIMRRLGPPAKDPKEDQAWKMVFQEQLLPPGVTVPPGISERLSEIDPMAVKEYSPYLKRLGLKLKRKSVPRAAPKTLNFSEKQVAPDSLNIPFNIVVTVTTEKTISAGYIVVEFVGRLARLSCDFVDSRLVLGNMEMVDNNELRDYLKDRELNTYTLAIGRTPFTPEKPVHVLASSAMPVHGTKVTLFDE